MIYSLNGQCVPSFSLQENDMVLRSSFNAVGVQVIHFHNTQVSFSDFYRDDRDVRNKRCFPIIGDYCR